jgi:hypothetical protein
VGKKVALELVSSCTWLFLQIFETGCYQQEKREGYSLGKVENRSLDQW